MSISRSLHLGPFAECERPRKGRPDVMDLTSEALRDVEVNKPGTFAIANVTRPGAPEGIDADEVIAVDLRSRDMSAECSWFAQAFAPELEKLRAAFGSVEVKWGLLQWFS